MSERPFMQLYVSDFVGDTLMLSAEHVGAYMLLLIALWNAHGELPNDDKKLARVARVTLKKWHLLSRDLLPFFEVTDTTITHRRLKKELQKSERQSQSRAAAGARGGAAKALNEKQRALANGVAMPKHLPEPYRKKGEKVLDPTEGFVDVNRHIDPDLFARCVAMTEPVKSFIEHKTFPRDIVAKARKELAN